MPPPRDASQSFWARVGQSGGDKCWLWTGAIRTNGYGAASFDMGNGTKIHAAHRIAYFLATGVHPGHLFVLHACDTPRCCNPAHLSTGTHADNMADCCAKGRMHPGERSGSAKVTAGQIREIRRRIADGERVVAVAADYAISERHVRSIRDRRKWRHIE